MKKIMIVKRDGEDRKITLETERDVCIFNDRDNDDTRWTEGYCHTTRSGEQHFYLARYTCWEGESDSIIPVSKEDFFREIPVTGVCEDPEVQEILALKEIPEL